MKKIQITTMPIKAEAEVIVLNSAFVARVAKSTAELTSTLNHIDRAVVSATKCGNKYEIPGTNVVEYTFSTTDRDIERLHTALTLISDIYKAFTDEDKGDNTSSKQ